jgi:hypothetical protein
MEIAIQPVDDFVKQGFVKKLSEQFRAPASFSTSPDALKSLKILLGNKAPAYPYIFVKLQSVAASQDSYNSHDLIRTGLPVQSSNRQTSMVRLLPVTMTVELTFITNKQSGDLDSVDGFTRRYLFARRNGSLSFNIDYGSTRLPISYSLDEAVNVTSRDNPTDAESVYQIVTTASIRGYVSEPALGNRGRVQTVILDQKVGTDLANFSTFISF